MWKLLGSVRQIQWPMPPWCKTDKWRYRCVLDTAPLKPKWVTEKVLWSPVCYESQWLLCGCNEVIPQKMLSRVVPISFLTCSLRRSVECFAVWSSTHCPMQCVHLQILLNVLWSYRFSEPGEMGKSGHLTFILKWPRINLGSELTVGMLGGACSFQAGPKTSPQRCLVISSSVVRHSLIKALGGHCVENPCFDRHFIFKFLAQATNLLSLQVTEHMWCATEGIDTHTWRSSTEVMFDNKVLSAGKMNHRISQDPGNKTFFKFSFQLFHQAQRTW